MPDPQVIPGTPANCVRVPYVVGFADNPKVSSEVYAGSGALIGLDCHLIKPVGSESDTLIVFMHPIGGGMYLPIVRGLADAGHHVVWANSRYRGVDAALIMERVACDLGEAILDAKTRLGYSKIVLAGMSGGGSVAMWYQALAEAGEGISDTAAGDVYVVDAERMPAANAIIMLVTHVGRHTLITEWMDASVRDEARPDDRDSELNLYDPANPNQPPYSADFLATYTAAQLERNRRITSWAKSKLGAIRESSDPHRELAFVVHGTAADPRWLDATVDPSDREPGTYYLGDPRLVNDGPVGLGRFCTLRSWISQWSYDDARADAEVAGANVSVPVLVLGATADNCCAPSHSARIFAGVAHDRKQLHMVKGAMHFFNNPDSTQYLDEAVCVIGEFIHSHLD